MDARAKPLRLLRPDCRSEPERVATLQLAQDWPRGDELGQAHRPCDVLSGGRENTRERLFPPDHSEQRLALGAVLGYRGREQALALRRQAEVDDAPVRRGRL